MCWVVVCGPAWKWVVLGGTGWCSVLLVGTGLYGAVPDYTELYRSVPDCIRLYQAVPSCTGLYRAVSCCTGLHRAVPGSAELPIELDAASVAKYGFAIEIRQAGGRLLGPAGAGRFAGDRIIRDPLEPTARDDPLPRHWLPLHTRSSALVPCWVQQPTGFESASGSKPEKRGQRFYLQTLYR